MKAHCLKSSSIRCQQASTKYTLPSILSTITRPLQSQFSIIHKPVFFNRLQPITVQQHDRLKQIISVLLSWLTRPFFINYKPALSSQSINTRLFWPFPHTPTPYPFPLSPINRIRHALAYDYLLPITILLGPLTHHFPLITHSQDHVQSIPTRNACLCLHATPGPVHPLFVYWITIKILHVKIIR